MKRILALILTTAMLLSLTAIALAQDTTADATSSATATPQGGQNGGVQGGNVSGTISAVGDGSITVAMAMGGQPPEGNPPQGGDGNQPNGGQQGDRPQGGGQTGGPGGDNGGGPGGQGGNGGGGDVPQQPAVGNGQAQAARTITITVTADTAITSGTDGSTLTLADLSAGMAVRVRVTGDAAGGYTATAITTVASDNAAGTAS